MSEPFILFGEQHTQALTYSFLIIAVLCVIGNFLSNKVQDIFAKLIGISLLVFEVTKPLYIFMALISLGKLTYHCICVILVLY